MSQRVDVLLVNPPTPREGYLVIRDVNRSGRMTRERMIWPQTNLAWLAALLRETMTVRVVDCIAEEMDWTAFTALLAEARPRYLVSNIISTSLTNDMYAHFLARRQGAVTIGMGPHVTDLPEESLAAFPTLDYAIRGEPERTLIDLIDACETGRNPATVQGIALRKAGDVVVTEERPFIEDLDELPRPAHELLPMDRYRMPFFGRYTFIIAGRGCPYSCIFCRQNVMWRSTVRMRSAASLLDETKYVLSLGCHNVMYQADTFTADRDMVLELCERIVHEGLRFRWACNTHVATIDEELVRAMKRAGCWMIAPGIESFNQSILDTIGKQITLDQIREAVHMIHDAGVEVWGYFVFGLPGDTHETLENNIRCALELPLDIANFAVAAPYPGTELYRMAKEEGWLTTEDWEQFDQNYSAILDYGVLTPAEIIAAVKRANLRFYGRPRPMMRLARELLRNPSAGASLGRVAWDHASFITGLRREQ